MIINGIKFDAVVLENLETKRNDFIDTSGIYFIEADCEVVYVGLSKNIYKRFIDHRNSLRWRKHANWKLQDMYILSVYGLTPELQCGILEICTEGKLKERERYWIEQFVNINACMNLDYDTQRLEAKLAGS